MSDSVPAKISRPRLLQVLARPRLFRALDHARKCPVVWISAPPGAGKTTLVSHYLEQRKLRNLWYQVDEGDADPATFFHYFGLAVETAACRGRKRLPHFTSEYLQGLPAFTRRYFEQIYRRLQSPCTLVFDDYQEAAANAALHEVMREALVSLPAGANVIVLSRTEPPQTLARVRASEAMSFVSWEELKLTPKECGDIVRRRKVRMEKTGLQRLYELTQGWPAGVMLALEQRSPAGITSTLPLESAPQAAFDYFAAEIFCRMQPDDQAVLLQAAFLPSMAAQRVIELTGAAHAERVLADLNRRNYFTLRHAQAQAVYQFHPLFREFLLARARGTYSPDALRQVQRKAAALLEADGEAAEAAALLIDAQAWDHLVRLIPAQAQTMLTQGRGRVLEMWLRALPATFLERVPWLPFWLGMCRLPFNPAEARGHFEKAFALFERAGDVAGTFLTWSGVMDTFVYEWGDFSPVDRWIAVLDELLARHPTFPSPQIEARVVSGMFTALMYRQPQRADLPQWVDRVQDIVLNSTDVRQQMLLGNQLLLYYTGWIGDLAKARLILDAVRAPRDAASDTPLAFIAWRCMEAAYHWFIASFDECMVAAESGLETARQSGAQVLNFFLLSQSVIGNLTGGNVEAAGKLLHEGVCMVKSARILDRAHYHYLVFLHAYFTDDRLRTVENARQAVALADAAGVPFGQALYRLGLAHALFDQGNRREAMACLARARRIGRGMRSANIELGCLFSAVLFALERGKRGLAIPLLRNTMAMVKRVGFINRPLWTPRNLVRLFSAALENDIETDYVRGLIRKRGLLPGEQRHFAHWPWPLKIYTLGGLCIEKDGEPVRFSGKVQRRPLDLLKITIALGGREVDTQRITDALWPDGEGDAAEDAFATALRRLRLLLGDPAALVLQDGKLSIDAHRVWVDVWALEDLLERKDTGPAEFSGVLALYQGPFLENEPGATWAWPLRERLRNRFLRELARHGQQLLQDRHCEEAIQFFEKGLEVDDLAEELYCKLMRCYQALGRRAEALGTYERCRKLLSSTLGVSPSPATEALRHALREQSARCTG